LNEHELILLLLAPHFHKLLLEELMITKNGLNESLPVRGLSSNRDNLLIILLDLILPQRKGFLSLEPLNEILTQIVVSNTELDHSPCIVVELVACLSSLSKAALNFIHRVMGANMNVALVALFGWVISFSYSCHGFGQRWCNQ